jgi:hypothetical protein
MRKPTKLNARKSAKINSMKTQSAETQSAKTQSAKPNVKKSLMRSNAHTRIKPKGFPSGTPLVFLLHCARKISRSVFSGPSLLRQSYPLSCLRSTLTRRLTSYTSLQVRMNHPLPASLSSLEETLKSERETVPAKLSRCWAYAAHFPSLTPDRSDGIHIPRSPKMITPRPDARTSRTMSVLAEPSPCSGP